MNRTGGFAETFNFLSRGSSPHVALVDGEIYDWGYSEPDARYQASETAKHYPPHGEISYKPASALAVAILQEYWPDIPPGCSIETTGADVYVTDES